MKHRFLTKVKDNRSLEISEVGELFQAPCGVDIFSAQSQSCSIHLHSIGIDLLNLKDSGNFFVRNSTAILFKRIWHCLYFLLEINVFSQKMIYFMNCHFWFSIFRSSLTIQQRTDNEKNSTLAHSQPPKHFYNLLFVRCTNL